MMKSLRKIHLWSGLSLGLLLSGLSLTGLVLMYQDAILSAWYPELAIQTQPSPLKTAAVLRLASEEYQQRSNLYTRATILVPQTPNAHYQIKWQGGDHQHLEYINPDTLQTVLARDSQRDWILWMFQFHSHLLAGDIGEEVLGILAMGILALVITGLWLWWPGRRRLKQNISPPRSRHTTAWLLWYHRVNGALFSPLLFIAILTGLGMVYYTPIKTTLVALADQQDITPVQYTMNCPVEAKKVSWQQQIEQVYSIFPDANIVRVYPSTSATKANRFRLKFAEEWHQNGRSYVYINPCNNEVVYALDARKDLTGAQWANMIYPIHSVHVGGVIYKSLMTLTALTPPLLFISGLVTWRKRLRPKKPSKKSKNYNYN
jgi:uncharacterized iron-regulated membrane protein